MTYSIFPTVKSQQRRMDLIHYPVKSHSFHYGTSHFNGWLMETTLEAHPVTFIKIIPLFLMENWNRNSNAPRNTIIDGHRSDHKISS